MNLRYHQLGVVVFSFWVFGEGLFVRFVVVVSGGVNDLILDAYVLETVSS